MAMIAEEERRMISARTKAGLAAAKRRDVKLVVIVPDGAVEARSRVRWKLAAAQHPMLT